MAPEVIKQKEYDSKADLWSVGITLFELLTGEPPLANIEPAQAVFLIPNHAPPRLDSSFSLAMRELVAACLHDDPKKRLSAEELLKMKPMKSLKSKACPLAPLIKEFMKNKKSEWLEDNEENDEGGEGKGTAWTFGTWKSLDEQKFYEQQASIQVGGSAESVLLVDPMERLGLSDPVSESIAQEVPTAFPVTPTKRSRHRASSSSIMEEHQRKSSLNSFSIDSIKSDDPLYSLIEEAQKRDEEYKKMLGLYRLNPIQGLNKDELYRLMIKLKQARVERPQKTDPLASEVTIRTAIEAHRSYSEKYLQLLEEAHRLINQFS